MKKKKQQGICIVGEKRKKEQIVQERKKITQRKKRKTFRNSQKPFSIVFDLVK